MTGLHRLLLMVSLGCSTGAHATAEAHVAVGSSIVTQVYGQAAQNVYVKILVPNLSYEKDVSVVFEKDSQRATIIARYVGPAEGGYEVWEAAANIDPGAHSFHVEYDAVPSSTERASYYLREGSGPVLYGDQAIMAIYNPRVARVGQAAFHVAVKNIAYQKKVLLHVSRDGWKSSSVVPLNYEAIFASDKGSVEMPNVEGFETWGVNLPLNSDVHHLDYYYTYEVSGQTFTDNNFGQNYSLELR